MTEPAPAPAPDAAFADLREEHVTVTPRSREEILEAGESVDDERPPRR